MLFLPDLIVTQTLLGASNWIEPFQIIYERDMYRYFIAQYKQNKHCIASQLIRKRKKKHFVDTFGNCSIHVAKANVKVCMLY